MITRGNSAFYRTLSMCSENSNVAFSENKDALLSENKDV